MSIRFVIKNTPAKAQMEGDQIVRFSGISEPFNRHSERFCRKVGVDGKGNPRFVFNTGLDKTKVDLYPWYSDEEKEVVRSSMDDLIKVVEDHYGKETLDSTNAYFWREDRNVNRLSLKNESIDVFFDTKNAVHALLYLSIISGAFIDLVAPTKDWAERHQIPHYMALEEEANSYQDENEFTKSEAHGALTDLRRNHGREALYILAWCLHYETETFGAYNLNTPEKNLIDYHIQFIEGKLIKKGKKRTSPRVFIEYYNRWLGQQTRPLLYAEAYIKAGDYFNLIVKRDKKYTTVDGTELGNNIPDAVKNITKPNRVQEFEKLRDMVEDKWKQ